MVVCQQALPSCHIWFISRGRLIYARPVGFGSHLTTPVTLLPSTNSGGSITCDLKENMDMIAENVQFDPQSRSIEKVVSTINPASPTVCQTSGDGSNHFLNVEHPEHFPCSSSTSLDSDFLEKETRDIQSKLEDAMIDVENSKQIAFEESLRRWRAEEDAVVAIREADEAERLCKEEINRNKEIEELLLKQKQEMDTMQYQLDQSSRELELIQVQKPDLESQLREAYCSENELEEKVIQAVNLLMTFREARDNLQMECDTAIRKVNKYRALQTEDHLGIPIAHFFGISFSDIIEATRNFDPSQKVGEGRFGNVFKGMLCHVKVAIKILPSSGSQSDSEFKNEMEVLCRVRHPNLVTIIGACPESRSLIYEYIENGNLDDYLSNPSKTNFLPWQTRIRIAIDICSALLFLHANNSCNVHGNLKPSNILLDVNLVTKISGFGICNLIPQNENSSNLHAYYSKTDPEKLAYMDPDLGELTTESDVYSFGVILLRLLTARPATSVVRDVKCALERENLETLLDTSAGDWPLGQAKVLADLGLRCCEKNRADRPDLGSEVWFVLESMRESCLISSSENDSRSQHKIPSHFLCPIFQEVMKDPHIAGDGFTYEADAIRGWFNSGHKTSPMTNLKLDNCDLLPNYALYYAIQEWQQNT